ncbi:MAG: hypothetical protein H0W36_11185 [Gemmatimonadetes bacterium]|nr:hypothetical protein [Gemmatimonadota bacterium]
MTLERVLTRDRSSGRIHERFRDGNRLLSGEACNLDDAGEFDVIGDVADVPADRLCRYCFSDPGTDPIPDEDMP